MLKMVLANLANIPFGRFVLSYKVSNNLFPKKAYWKCAYKIYKKLKITITDIIYQNKKSKCIIKKTMNKLLL